MGNEITSLLTAVSAKLEAAKEFRNAHQKEYAFDFNLFNQFFNLGENKTSEILAYFLNPKEGHGQGDVFLKSFLDLINLDDRKLLESPVKIKVEKVIADKRRIDIVLEWTNFAIGIENKIWAEDQFKQLEDYYSHLSMFDNYKLIYLTPYNSAPSEDSLSSERLKAWEEEGRYQAIDYSSDLLQLCDEWINSCQADNVRNFLKQFKTHLELKINGIMAESKKVVLPVMTQTPNNKIASLYIENAMPELKKEIIRCEFSQSLENYIGTNYEGILGKMTFDFRKGTPLWKWKIEKCDSLYFILAFHKENYKDLWYGLVYDKTAVKNPDANWNDKVEAFYLSLLSTNELEFSNRYRAAINGKRGHSWPAYKSFEVNNWNKNQFEKIVSDPDEFVENLVKTVLEKLRSIIDLEHFLSANAQ